MPETPVNVNYPIRYGGRVAVEGTQSLGTNPPGFATIIPYSETSIEKLDLYVTGWMEPNHTLESNIGTEKIEDGSPITDHVVAMPAKLRLTGMVSDITQGADAPFTAWDQVRLLHDNEEILQVVTEFGAYKEMVIKRAQTTQTNRGMEFTLELQQIRRVGVSQFEQATSDPNSVISGMGEEQDVGDKDLVDAPVTPLGNRRFRLGSATDPASQIITYDLDENGNPITDDSGNIRYYTVEPKDQ